MVVSGFRIKGETGDWEVVVGLEVHAQVVSNAKLFSGAATAFGAEPNSQVSLYPWNTPELKPIAVRHVRSFLRSFRPGVAPSA